MEKELFELDYQDQKLTIERIPVPNQVMFKVWFPSRKTVVFICRTINANKETFWASLPEGKENFAAKIGLLIDAYLNI